MKESITLVNKKIVLIFIFMTSFTFSQQNNTSDFWKNVRYGGGIGLSFGDGFFSGTLAPSAIYEFNPQFGLGVGLNGTISNQKNIYKSTILGGSIISMFNPINEIQLSAEYEQLNVHRVYNNALNLNDDNYWSPALFFGVGYRNGNVTFGLRYDVLYDVEKSIYADPWAPFVRFYF
jgi:predicted porin